jgi:hypothetical protein
MSELRLRLPARDVRKWAARYDQGVDDGLAELGQRARKRGYLTGKDLRALARWKTPRTAAQVARNAEGFVRDVTRVAFATECERPRIEVLLLLRGVAWPTASVILHFVYPERYPVLDYRALWSVGVSPAPLYGFAFWERYLAFTRATARRLEVTMRDLDRALWQYSKEKQR